MGEPATTVGAVVVGVTGAGLAGYLATLNGEAAIGALLGALLYFTTTRELPVWQRALFFVVSFVMGYLFAPGLVDAEFWGVRPFRLAGPAAFAASVLVVTVALAAIKRRAPPVGNGGEGGTDA